MKLENQVVSLEIAKKLKELGVKQDAYHSWCFIEAHNDYELDNGDYSHSFSAFTVAELGEMLPGYNYHYCYSFRTGAGGASCVYEFAQTKEIIQQEYAETEADARGKMLIYLLENNLIEVKALIQEEIKKS